MWVRVSGELELARRALEGSSDVVKTEIVDGRLRITMKDHLSDPALVSTALFAAGAKLTEFREAELGLEEVFMRVTRGETQ